MAANTDANSVPVPSWGPAYQGVAITKSDATDLTTSKIRGLWVGGAGDVAVIFFGDSTNTAVTISSVPAGTLLPIAVKKVMNTNTTATNMVGLI